MPWESGFRKDSRSRFDDRPSGRSDFNRGEDYWGPVQSRNSMGNNFMGSGDSDRSFGGGSRMVNQSSSNFDGAPSQFGSGGMSGYGKNMSQSFNNNGPPQNFNDGQISHNFNDRSSRSFSDRTPRNFDTNRVSQDYDNSNPQQNYGNFGGNNPSSASDSFSGYSQGGSSNYGSGGSSGYRSSGPNAPSNFGPSAPSKFGGGPALPGSDMGPNRGGRPPMGPSEAGCEDPNLYSSIQTLSKNLNVQQSEIASKIISAVLTTTNMMGTLVNKAQDTSYNQGEMGEGRFNSRISYSRGSSSRSSSFGSPRGGFSRYARGGRVSPRGRYSSSSRFGFDRNRLGLRNLRSQKRSLHRDSPPKDSSRRKRRKSESVERKMKSDNEEDEKTERDEVRKESRSSSKDRKESSDKDDIPLAALYCHMCKHGNFTSVKTYLYHLDGIKHKKVAMAFNAKNESTLEYLRKSAKLANLRFGGKESNVVASKCTICSAVIKESFGKHKKLFEHRLVKKFMTPTCCGRYFKSRYDMNEHRLSLPHLRKVYELGQHENPFIDEIIKGKHDEQTFEEIVQILKNRHPGIDGHLTLNNVPPYDGNSAIGVNMLQPASAAMCKACRILIPNRLQSFDMHLSTMEHYNAVTQYLRDQGSELRKEKIKKSQEENKSEKFRREDRSSGEEDSDDEGDEGHTVNLTRGEDTEDEEEEDYQSKRQDEIESEVIKPDNDKEEGAGGGEELDYDEEQQALEEAMEGKDETEMKDGEELPFIDDNTHIVLEEVGEDLGPGEEEN